MNNFRGNQNWVRRNCIGKGSFGAVSLASQKSDAGLVFAVKSVDINSGHLLRCLENEIRILKSLSSPYVVSYLGDDVTWEASSVYRNLHMEYMSGGTVVDVAKHGDIGHVNLRTYTWCITSALSYIHARNVVHCDVKGANVLIGDSPGKAKLADFGSAVELGDRFSGTRGSPLWMAPEVIRGEFIGPESDVWSLGCTVIEILTGKPAWQDRGADTLRQIGYSEDLPEFPTPLPDDLRDFLHKCLKREPSKRWSCNQLLQHPFLLSCSSPSSPQITINESNSSPRCVFDWSDLNSSNESTVDMYESSTSSSSSDAKQRIGKLASRSGVNWESEGWEVVRHVTDTISSEILEAGETSSDWCDSWGTGSTRSEARGTKVIGMYRDSVDRYGSKICVWIKNMFPRMMFILNVILHIHYTQWLTSTSSLLRIQFGF